MWTLVLIYYLGLGICQANAKENSTQMYFVKLKIDVNAITNFTNILSTPIETNTSLQLTGVEMTTICSHVNQRTECQCQSGYRWRNAVCTQYACCGDETCIFNKKTFDMCISDATVTVAGSLTLKGKKYQDCLTEKTNPLFKRCNQELTEEMKMIYSTLTGFHSLIINKYSVGSVIADFELTVSSHIEPKFLESVSIRLVSALNSSLFMETTGVVNISSTPNPLKYNSYAIVTCTVPTNLNTYAEWKIKKGQRVYDITNGTGSTVTSSTLDTTVSLRNVSELWEGEYSCAYTKEQNSITIRHKASSIIDVCLIQDIDTTTTPAFPQCTETLREVYVRMSCTLKKAHENYTVAWKTDQIGADITRQDVFYSDSTITYSAVTYFRCDGDREPTVMCIFNNRCNQTSTGTIKIVIISVSDLYCEAEGDWQNTKAGHTAVLTCKTGTGQRKRKCTQKGNQGIWQEEEVNCVNQELQRVLQSAVIADSGLGSLDTNAAEVFSNFEAITDDTDDINSVANLNISVEVLDSLSQKLEDINNETTANDLLQSSSNLLESSLESLWLKTRDNGETLAERYLDSVEYLIEVTNATKANRKPNLELDVSDGVQQYKNRVFNVSVSLIGSNLGQVKTAGFKNLEQYFPHNDSYEPNGVIISTTTQTKQHTGLEIHINFQLLKPRPRNVMMECVSWNREIRQWSSDGCHWDGPSKEGYCVCSHLSSFTILLSKIPLELAWLSEITYVGLSVSIVSLIFSLIIELIIWSHVVKTSGLYLRHTAHVNICLCLLIADICFLASSQPSDISSIWCQTFVVLKHFCYLSMFFWMLCLSTTLLHRTVFPFHEVSKRNYLRFSIILGYVCPLLIVFITFLTNRGGADGYYFSSDTCWLIYSGPMKGSLHTFLIPIGIIIFVSIFSMLMVIMKLLGQTNNTDKLHQTDKNAAKTVVRTVVLLAPIFGVTWIFGFGVTFLDLTHGIVAYVVNYAFTLLNSFQGLFILLTINLGEKTTREVLINFIKKNNPTSTDVSTTREDLSSSSSSSSSSLKK